MRDARTGIEMLDRSHCMRLLADDDVGRLAVLAGDAPVIFPVNYALDGEDIVVRTAAGTKLAGVGRTACFEIDAFERSTRHGWSVVVSGRLDEIDGYAARDLARLRTLELSPWADGQREHWLRLTTTTVTGRRVGSMA